MPSGDHLGDESLSNDGSSHLIGISLFWKIPINDLSVLYDTNATFVPSGDQIWDPFLPLEWKSFFGSPSPLIDDTHNCPF